MQKDHVITSRLLEGRTLEEVATLEGCTLTKARNTAQRVCRAANMERYLKLLEINSNKEPGLGLLRANKEHFQKYLRV